MRVKNTCSDSVRNFDLLLQLCAPQRGLQVRKSNCSLLEVECLDSLVDVARKHRVTGLLYNSVFQSVNLRKAFENCASFEELKKNRIAGEVFRNFVYGEWIRIFSFFREQSISVVQIKGLSLAMELYGNPFAREYRDLDILCEETDLRKLVKPMESLGYRLIHFDEELEKKEPGMQLRMVHHLVMEHPVMKLSVEFHNRLSKLQSQRPSPSVKSLLARSCTMKWKGDEWTTLNSIDHGLYMISHGALHFWCLMHWLLDLAVFWAQSSEYDWTTFLHRARELKLERTISLSLTLCHHFFEFVTPEILLPLESIWDSRLQKALLFVLRYLPAGAQVSGDYAHLFGFRFSFLAALDDTPRPLRDMIREFAGSGYMQARLWGFPRLLTPLYWPIKFCIVFFKALRRLNRKFFRTKGGLW